MHAIDTSDAATIADWLKNRGGILIWDSADLSDPGASWTTPALNADGTPVGKPTWKARDKPTRHITSPDDVEVVTPREIKRFHVGVRPSSGLSLKVTDGGSRKIRNEVEKAAVKYGDAWYEFDYESYDNAVIVVADRKVPLKEWINNAQSVL